MNHFKSHISDMNDPQVFRRLLEDANKPLYPGCMKYTKLLALVQLYNLKACYGWSDKEFSELLQLLGDMLPLNNEMSLSIYEVKKTFSALRMEYKKFMHVLMIVFCIETNIRMLLHA